MSRLRFLHLIYLTPLFLVAAFELIPEVSAQTTLSAGDVVTIGVTSDASDSFAFVLLSDVQAGTVIRFMDHSFTNATNGVLGTENDMSLTFTTALSAGSVIRVEDGGTTLVNGGSFSGTKSGNLSGVSASGDQIFIYQGTAMGSGTNFTGRTLLHGINVSDTSWLTTGTADSNASYLPTAISGPDLNLDSGNFDNLDYNGTRTGMTAAAYRAAFANIANYTQNDTRFDLATGGFTIENTLFLHWDANGTTVGDGGTGTWDTTTQSRFKNGASGTTYLRWVNRSAGNDHTAVFGGTAGTVSIATGGVTASGLHFNTTGYLVQNNTVTLSAAATPVVSVGDGLTATVNSALAGSQGFEKTGGGILILGGAQDGLTVTGITVSAGTLRAGATDVNFIPSVGTLTVASGATLDLNGWAESIAGLSGAGIVTTGAATTNVRFGVGDANVSTIFDGLIENGAGSLYLQKNGTGSLTLTNPSNSFSGTVIDSSNNRALPTTIHLASGKLAFTSNGALGVAGGDLYLDGGSFASDALVFGGDGITLDGGRTLNVNNLTSIEVGSGRTGTVAGPIWGDDNNGAAVGGNDSIQKTGAGTLILSGGTDQIDEFFVAEGTLIAQSTIDTARITVSAGATLGGSGTITGDTDVNGTLSTGSSAAAGSVGDLTFSGVATDLTFSVGSLWLVDVVQGAIDNADTVAVGGTLSLGDSVFDPTFLFTGTYTLGTKYTLATYGSLAGSFSSFADNAVYTLGGAGGGDYLFRYNDAGAITLTAVPEPGSLVILGVVGGICYWRRRSGRVMTK